MVVFDNISKDIDMEFETILEMFQAQKVTIIDKAKNALVLEKKWQK